MQLSPCLYDTLVREMPSPKHVRIKQLSSFAHLSPRFLLQRNAELFETADDQIRLRPSSCFALFPATEPPSGGGAIQQRCAMRAAVCSVQCAVCRVP